MQNAIQIQPHIPLRVRLELNQLDPFLDTSSWQTTLINILQKQDKFVQNLIYEQILLPKGIAFNKQTRKFVVQNKRPSLQNLYGTLTTPHTRILTEHLINSLELISKETTFNKFADYLESIVDQIDQIETEDKPIINQEKKLVKVHFLYDICAILDKNTYTIPENTRNLTQNQIKSFIKDIYIRKLISEYSFNSIRPELLKSKNSVIIDYLLKEQKNRQFEIFEGSNYYYVITPASQADEDPYSIRRFFYEDKSLVCNKRYLNGIIIEKSIIDSQQSAVSSQQSAVSRV